MGIPNFNYKIESLSSQHDRENFDCGIKSLNGSGKYVVIL
jgi:hypothetical protein